MKTTGSRTAYPWLMQIIVTVLALGGMVWFGWHANDPDDQIIIGMVSRKTGWVLVNESPYNWSVKIGFRAESVAIVGAILLAIVPLFVWAARRSGKPRGFYCSRCHKYLGKEQTLASWQEVLVCDDCARAMEDIGETGFVYLQPRRDEESETNSQD
ncbi:MAG: hypothetical protein GY794_08455 [bacterium]|nr:hypothetical protein [bacterium]